MAIPSNEHDESKSESGESNNNCNKTVKCQKYCLEISCTRKCKIDKTVPNCFIRSCRIVLEINKKTHGSCTDPEIQHSTDSNCVVQNLQKLTKNKTSKVVVSSPTVILVLGIFIFHLLYAMKRLHSRGCGAFHRVNKKTVSANKETIRNYVYTFFNEMCRKTISSFYLKRYKHILDLSNICFNSTYTVYPANTLTEYYREIESSSETSFQERMQFDMFRTSTFSEFPRNSPVSTLMLAKAGFYYEGKEDEVKCFKCGKKYRNWQQLDDPIQIHRAISPSCAFVSKLGNSQNPQNQSSRGNHESVLYRREHEDMIERNENANTSEHASVSHSVHISNESIQNNDTENRGLNFADF